MKNPEPQSDVTPRHHSALKIIIGIISIPLALFIFLLAAGFVLSILSRSERISRGDYSTAASSGQQPAVSSATKTDRLRFEGEGNYSLGPDSAALTIVQFSDFACPYCLASFPSLREASLKYAGNVRFVFRDWPGHDNSISLAMSAYCAGEQGKFWEMHDKLFQNQSESFGANATDLVLPARQLGLDTSQFSACMTGQKYLSQIRSNFAASQALGVRGTPTWFIEGEKIEGALTSAELDTLIQDRLR